MARGGEPVAIGRLIKDIFSRRRLAGGSHQLMSVRTAWREAAGPELAARTRVVALRGGEVVIEADTAALAYELRGFERDRLLARIRRRPETDFVVTLKFRTGTQLDGRG